MIKRIISTLFALILAGCSQEEVSYTAFLEAQVQKWHRLSSLQIERLAPHYDFELEEVRYAENIHTVSGFVVTLDSKMFFPGLVSRNKFSVMAHELEHIAQYKRNPMLFNKYYYAESLISAAHTLASGEKLSVTAIHDNIKLEQQAKIKAQTVLESINSLDWIKKPNFNSN